MVIAAASFAFLLLQLAPGDQYSKLYDIPGVTSREIDDLRHRYGADRPAAVQYLHWLREVASGNLGQSTETHRPVVATLATVLPNTLVLMVPALAASIVLGVLIGQWQAVHADSPADRITSTISFIVHSMPEFWLAMLLLLLFSETLRWLPSGGMSGDMDRYLPLGVQLLRRLRHLVLPLLSLTIVATAVFARYQRAAMRDILHEPFVASARSRGLSERGVLRHARRASLTSVVTLGGLFLPAVVTGAVFVESVFSWPGMGYTMLLAVRRQDYPLVTGIVVVGSAMTVVASLAADILRDVVDPRGRQR